MMRISMGESVGGPCSKGMANTTALGNATDNSLWMAPSISPVASADVVFTQAAAKLGMRSFSEITL